MGKKEKYIKFIIKDLLDKTIMEYDVPHFKAPFWGKKANYRILSESIDGFPDVIEYLSTHYGVGGEEMVEIWDFYGWHVQSAITGKYE